MEDQTMPPLPPESENISSELVDEIAAEYGFTPSSLHTAMVAAAGAFLFEFRLHSWRHKASRHIAAVSRVLGQVKRAADVWSDLSDEARQEVVFFEDCEETGDPVGRDLAHAVGLLEEYCDHYKAQKGNPRKSRTGNGEMLQPLEIFAAHMIQFWENTAGLPFGYVVQRQNDVDGYDPKRENAPRVAHSKSLEFLIATALCLPQAHRYSNANFETVVRSVLKQPR
ncbi:hypothetical protein [Mesorhizobium sp. M0036]|uniref:hypothetical protein n=1 Tax=Mesorhizobium sp. M0036 TaxID=2956853 RepID=UPI003338B4DB